MNNHPWGEMVSHEPWTLRLVLPNYAPPSWNEWYAASGRQAKALRDEHCELTRLLVRAALDPAWIETMPRQPFAVATVVTGGRLDPDNIVAKLLIDGVRHWFGINDDPGWIVGSAARVVMVRGSSVPQTEVWLRHCSSDEWEAYLMALAEGVPAVMWRLPEERPLSWNHLYSGRHWSRRAAEARRVHDLVAATPPQWIGSLLPDQPLIWSLHATFRGIAQDADNLILKMYLDGGRVILGREDTPRDVALVHTTTRLASPNSPPLLHLLAHTAQSLAVANTWWGWQWCTWATPGTSTSAPPSSSSSLEGKVR